MDEIILSKKLFEVGKGKYSNLNALIVGGSGTNKLGF